MAADVTRDTPVGTDAHAAERFRAMGSDAHLIVAGPDAAALLRRGRRRIEELEQRWSRFRDDSEISELNRRAGEPVVVSEDTWALLTRAIDGWRVTGGCFDPTVLDAVVAAGYDRSFDDLVAAGDRVERTGPAPARRARGCDGIVTVPPARMIVLPEGVRIDPGGIGKGLAADLVVAELLAAGATGVCVNLGGDLRVDGRPPAGSAWGVDVEDPWSGEVRARLSLTSGAVATTSRTRRFWETADGRRHHVIDPATGMSASSGLAAVTVVTGEAWRAEVLAKAAFVAGTAGAGVVLDAHADGALLFTDEGDLVTVGAIGEYLT